MKTNDQNLKALLARFVNEAAADVMAEDIQKGDTLLDRFPAPVLRDEAKKRLYARLGAAAAARRHHRLFLGGASVAATIAVILVLFGGSDVTPPAVGPESKPIAMASTPSAVRDLPVFALNLWDEAFYADSDASYAAIKDELDNIAASIEAVQFQRLDFSGERIINGDDTEHRDTQLSKTDFWKG